MSDRAYVPEAYWERLLAGQHDQSGVGYPSLAVAFNAAMYRALIEQTDWLLRRSGLLGQPPRRVLDIGSGTGVWVRFWLEHGAGEVTGVDLTEAAVARLTDRFPTAHFERADVSERLPEGPFDAVSAMSVLLHVTDADRWRAALANLADALAPGGFAVLIEPVVVHRWWGPPFDSTSNSIARPLAEWNSALAAAGLRVEAIRPATVLLANVVDTRSALAFRALRAYWTAICLGVGRRERLGRLVGALLGAADRPLRRALPGGPTAKLLLLRRAG